MDNDLEGAHPRCKNLSPSRATWNKENKEVKTKDRTNIIVTKQRYHASVNSSSAHPPRADPRELAFFENELAKMPHRRGKKSCPNAPG